MISDKKAEIYREFLRLLENFVSQKEKKRYFEPKKQDKCKTEPKQNGSQIFFSHTGLEYQQSYTVKHYGLQRL